MAVRRLTALVAIVLAAGCTPVNDAGTPDETDVPSPRDSASQGPAPDDGLLGVEGWACDDATELDLADLATRDASLPAVRELVERCLRDETATDAVDRALGRAAQFGHADVVSDLIGLGADVDYSGAAGLPVMVWAARPLQVPVSPVDGLDANKADVVQNLARAGADIEARAIDGLTALIAAAMNSAELPLAVIGILLDAGADPTGALDDGRTATDLARELGRDDIVKLIEGS